jgi:acid phosphatase type 7
MRAIVFLCCAIPALAQFVEKPYLQLGDNPKPTAKESLVLMWQAESDQGSWMVEVGDKGKFRKTAAAPVSKLIALHDTPRHFVYSVTLNNLKPGAVFDYRVSLNGSVVFQSKGKARPAASASSYRFVAFGDSGADTSDQKAIAALTHKLDPGMIFHTGDIVYSRGQVREYRKNHFPIYNSDESAPNVGAPLIRSTVMLASAGNHDLAARDLGKYPDALAYFFYWSMPLNAPVHPMFAKLEGPAERVNAFKSAAGATFPRMVNYSFDWGNSHWLVLDSNSYADWSDKDFQKWIADDLAASKATWKFVGLHHPGFNSSKAHFKDQQMRLVAPIFEKYGVDVVFSGHVHNYQRSYPMRFEVGKYDRPKSLEVDGSWKLDRTFDGVKTTKPDGVIYLVTGAGGNSLYNPEQQDDQKSWQEFTVKFVSKIHSLTEVEVTGKRAAFKQYDKNGTLIDQFTVSK